MNISYMTGAEPFTLSSTSPQTTTSGCLLLHGFMSSPYEMRWLGESLTNDGYFVHAPCLPGHGTTPEDMTSVTWEDWLATAQALYKQLLSEYEHVYLIGHSMGGTLALLLASLAKVQPAGVVALAAPVILDSARIRMTRWYKYAIPYTDQSDTSNLPDYVRQQQTLRGEPTLGRVRYDLWSTAAVYELYQLTRAAYTQLGGISAPLQLIYAEQDATVSCEQIDIVAERVHSSIIEKHVLLESGHNLQLDIEHEKVFGLVKSFLNRTKPIE